MSFEGKVCVITGAASGIGEAVAIRLAEAGGRVVLADLEDAGQLATRLGGHYVRTDVSDESSVEALMAAAASFGPIDVLVNNAGIMSELAIDELSEIEFLRLVNVNTVGVLLGMKHAARSMRVGSAIVNTASLAGRVGLSGYAAYAASKAAVISLTQVAAMEYGPEGIRVNCICPSSVETPMLLAQENGDVEREVSRLASPLGATITAAEAAEVIVFLASPASSAITGQAINVDAGASAGYSNQLLEALVGAPID